MGSIERNLAGRHGALSVRESDSTGAPLLLIHGVGASKDVFSKQFDSQLARTFRLVAFDLPGHGRSENASNPEAAYTLSGMATAAIDVLAGLGISRATVFGWSLGGHIAIQMLHSRPDMMSGLMLTGTPPVGRGPLAMLRAVRLRPEMLFSTRAVYSASEAERFARVCFGECTTPQLVADVVRSDGQSRAVLYRNMLKRDVLDQRQVVETSPVPIAMVNGAHEPVVRLNYLESLHYRQLWEGACHVIEGAAHSPFLQRPERFNALLGRFAAEIAGTRESAPYREAQSA